ncbi:MAG: glycerate kinase, partial [Chloroflexi bacterium]|nr:glycerate kinase [Chloroflexota bacterium]
MSPLDIQFGSETLWAHEVPAAVRADLRQSLLAALQAVDPARALQRYRCQRRGRSGVCVPPLRAWLREGARAQSEFVPWPDPPGRVFLIAVGKAAYPMARAAYEALGGHLAEGLIITKDGYAGPGWPRVTVMEAGHPVPDARSVEAAQRVFRLLQQTQPDDMVLALISGGGSALLTWPADGLTLADLRQVTQALLASGATIHEINTVRKHLDRVKGGGMARWAAPARVITFALSDVLGDDLSVIASGPTVPDPTTFADAWAVLAHYDLLDRVPASVRAYLEQGLRTGQGETAKPDDPIFRRAWAAVIGSVRIAVEAAAKACQARNWTAQILTTTLMGEAHEVAHVWAAVGREMARADRPVPRPGCVLAGGETTVTLGPQPGLGGRNQALALATALAWHALPPAGPMALVALATDGTDGPTDAAGAIVTPQTVARARAMGLDARAFLRGFDAYTFFHRAGGLLFTGPTQTNVNDLV